MSSATVTVTVSVPSATATPSDTCEFTNLTRNDSIGLAFVVEAGILSATSLAILALLILRNIWRYKKYAKAYKWSLVEQPSDVYVLSLFVADVMQAIGASMSARWVSDGTVTAGRYCTAQGAIQQLGETSVGLATMLIAIHTFMSVWMRKEHTVRTALIIVAFSWIFMGLFVGIAAGLHHNYDEPTPFWCWVGSQFLEERIWGEYFWLWFTLAVAIAAYLPLFLWHQGYIDIDEQKWWVVTWNKRTSGEADGESRGRPLASSMKLLAYPVAYSIVVLPVSIVRWITFGDGSGCGVDPHIPRAATFATVFLHDCFGFVNVLLLLTTRQTLLLFDDPKNQKRERPMKEGGGVLDDWDEGAHINGKGRNSSSPSPSPNDSYVGTRNVGDPNANGNGNATGNDTTRRSQSSYGEEDDTDARIGMIMRAIQPSSTSLTSDARRTGTLESTRDVLGALPHGGRRMGSGASGQPESIESGLPSPSQRSVRSGTGSARDNAYGERAQPPQRDGRSGSVTSQQQQTQSQSQQHGPANLLARLHSRGNSGGSGPGPQRGGSAGADEYSDEEIERRLASLTSQSTNTNSSRVPVPRYGP